MCVCVYYYMFIKVPVYDFSFCFSFCLLFFIYILFLYEASMLLLSFVSRHAHLVSALCRHKYCGYVSREVVTVVAFGIRRLIRITLLQQLPITMVSDQSMSGFLVSRFPTSMNCLSFRLMKLSLGFEALFNQHVM